MAITDIITGAASFARGLITPTRAIDVVAITGSGFAPMFAAARPLTASVYEFADIMEHPLETGAVIADHIVFQPVEIELPLMCVGEFAYRSTYAALRGTFKAGTLLTILTRTGSYPNMVIIDLPHDETPDQFDAIAIRVRLSEARFVSPKTGLSQSQVKNPSQASTANRGAQQTSAANASTSAKASSTVAASQTPTPQGSTLRQWYDGATQ
jgi:hypothetical protein